MLNSRSRITLAVVTLLTSFMALAACGGTDSAERTRNAALPASSVLPYSCAQLLTDTATEATTEVRFTLCDDAELYSIVTPDGVAGAINDQAVQGGEEVSVPVGSEVNGPATQFIVKTQGASADDDPAYHSGVHIYRVSLATPEEDFVGANSTLLGTVYPKVSYDMPTPQTWAVYQKGPFGLPGGLGQYVAYIDELAQKWAMVKLTTCQSLLAHAQMADAVMTNQGFGAAQLNAKRLRSISMFFATEKIRVFTEQHDSQANICEPGVNGFNLFVDGVNEGFTPVAATEIASSTDDVALATSFALLRYWKQIVTNTCEAPSGATVDFEAAELDTWSTQMFSRVQALRDDVTRTAVERVSSRRLLDQMAMIDLIGEMHISTWGGCAMIAAGYAVPARQNIEAVLQQASDTLPPSVESQSNNDAVAPPLSEIVTNPAPSVTVPQSELVWTEDVTEVAPTTTTSVPATSTTVEEAESPQTTVVNAPGDVSSDDSSGSGPFMWLFIALVALLLAAFGVRQLRR